MSTEKREIQIAADKLVLSLWCSLSESEAGPSVISFSFDGTLVFSESTLDQNFQLRSFIPNSVNIQFNEY